MYLFCCFLIWLVSSIVTYRFFHKYTCSEKQENESECSGAAILLILLVLTIVFWGIVSYNMKNPMCTKTELVEMRHCDVSPLDERERNLESCLNDLDDKNRIIARLIVNQDLCNKR